MFNGIIRDRAIIKEIRGDSDLIILNFEWVDIPPETKTGDSVAIDGACLTVKEILPKGFTTEVMPETLQKTIIDSYRPGTCVNLELPLKVGERIDGHFTGGHIDYTGLVIQVIELEKTVNLEIDMPEKYRKLFAVKGSVTVNGVSLTIGALDTASFTVCIIPQTLKETNLGKLKPGDRVNIETDMLARYLDSLISAKENQITYSFLRERNFI